MSTQTYVLESGTLLLERYRIQDSQAQDAMSQFFWAADTRFDNMPVLVRAIHIKGAGEALTQTFSTAAQTGAILGHQSPHIVQVLNYGVHDAVPFYILESSKHTTLKTLLNPGLTTARFLGLMQQVCLGLASAHQGCLKDGEQIAIFHGDLKPTNILVFADSGLGEIAKILSFGLREVVAGGRGRACFVGTPAYSAPEHFEGKTSAQSDLYSLGVILFLGLTGRLPIQPEGATLKDWYQAHLHTAPLALQSAAPTLLLPQALSELVMGCLAKNPQDRPQGAAEVADCLKDCLQEFTPSLEAQASETKRAGTPAGSNMMAGAGAGAGSMFAQQANRAKNMVGSVA